MPNIITIDDVTPDRIIGETGGGGYETRDWDAHPYGVTAYAKPFPNEAFIERKDMEGMIRQQQIDKTRLTDYMEAANWKPKDQKNTLYCWTNAVTGCFEIARIKQNDPYIPLSSASVAAVIKRFRNQGGYGSQALKFTVERGFATHETWPNHVINPGQAAIQKADTERINFMSLEYYDLEPGPQMFDCFLSALIHRWPCAPGYDWWRHQVCAVEAMFFGGGVMGCRGPNSYGGPWFELKGDKARPDDCVCLHSVTPSVGVAA